MFADLIAQWGGPAAFTRALGNKHLHGKVSVEAAQQLVSWSDLDEVIINQRLAPPDLFLADNGQVIPPRAIWTQVPLRSGKTIPWSTRQNCGNVLPLAPLS